MLLINLEAAALSLKFDFMTKNNSKRNNKGCFTVKTVQACPNFETLIGNFEDENETLN